MRWFSSATSISLCAFAIILSLGPAKLSAQEPDPQPNPETILVTDGQSPPIEVSFDTEMRGGDYDTGASNPALDGVDFDECRVICQLDDRCKAYSHDGNAQICSLKDSVGEKIPATGAISGIFVDRPERGQTTVVERSGDDPAFDETLGWQPNDTPKSRLKRIRDAATPLGDYCEIESAMLDTLKEGLTIHAPQQAIVGQDATVEWSGNSLTTRIPVWIVLSTPTPVRFSGKGFVGLNAGAPGPFGVDTAVDQMRAFVALYNYSVRAAGSVGVVPLLAGRMTLHATLVAYLRTCGKQVELSSQEFAVDVKPAAPRIVVHDPYALNIYTREVDVTAIGRKVLYNKERFLILDSEFGSEILERNGTSLQFSPTRRYVLVRNDNAFDVIDIVDGSVVSRIGDSQSATLLGWFHHDSFVAMTRAPYGNAWLASTLNARRPLFAYQPDAACCNFSGMIDVDLENNLARMIGLNAGMAANLQDFDVTVDEPGLQGDVDNRFRYSSMVFLKALGTVSPIWDPATQMSAGASMWNTPSAVVDSADAEQANDVSAPDVTVELAPPGDELAETRGAISLIKPEDRKRSGAVDLDSFGFQVAPEVEAKPLLSPHDISEDEHTAAAEKTRAGVRATLSKALKKHKIKVEWMVPRGLQIDGLDCDYIRAAKDASQSALPGALTIVQRLERSEGDVWIVRSTCDAGGTSASQDFKSALMVIDEARLRGKPARAAIVEEHATQGTSFERVFHDHDFRTKLIGDRVLFVMPAHGAIGLFDLKTRTFLYRKENLTRGDLLSDAHVSADGRFILQINSDNSFALHRIEDAKLVLEGRQADGETVFWTPDFRFDSTAEGASFVELRFPGQYGQYTFQQFDTRLRQSGLLDAVLKDAPPPPTVAIDVPPRLRGSLSANNGRIVGEVTPTSSGALKEIRLYQDGILTDRFAAHASGTPLPISAIRLPGTRWVSLVAADQEGLVSLPVGRDLGADRALAKTHLLSIGINAYDDQRLPDLGLARQDALNLSEALGNLDGTSIALPQDARVTLTDAGATRDAILGAAKNMIDSTSPGDNAVLFFAGHGLQGKDGRFYLGLSTTSVDNVEATGLAWSDLAAILATAKGRVTVLLDACHSGTAGTGLLASNDDAVSSIRDAIPSGLTVLAASKGRELSAELRSLGGGVFTVALVQAIGADREKTDADRNGRIEVSELYRAVKDRVTALRNGEQTPWLSRNQMIGDFSIF